MTGAAGQLLPLARADAEAVSATGKRDLPAPAGSDIPAPNHPSRSGDRGGRRRSRWLPTPGGDMNNDEKRPLNWTRIIRNTSAGVVASIAGYASYWHQVD